MNPNAQLIEVMKTLTFGVEIETVGAPRRALANAIASVFPGSTAVSDGYADKWTVTIADGRKWSVVHDGSLSSGNSGEVVTPICTWADFDDIQAVIRALRSVAHARVDSSCGVHVHVGTPADRFNAKAIVRLAKIVYAQEPLIFAALGVASHRRERYTRSVDEAFITRAAATQPANREALAVAWYGNESEVRYSQTQHYHSSRYRGLNLHSVFYRGTAEFRYFEGTLHAGQIKSYVQFCLALATKALTSSGAGARKRTYNPATSKYDFRVFLLRLGLIGDEFKTARLHLAAKLAGSSSRKHGTPPSVPAVAVAAAVAPDGASTTPGTGATGWRSSCDCAACATSRASTPTFSPAAPACDHR